MARWLRLVSFVAASAIPLGGCGDGEEASPPTSVGSASSSGSVPASSVTGSGPTPSPEPATTAAAAIEFECRADRNCPEILVEGDPPATLPSGAPAPLRGYSDPTIRRDPASGRLWMAYSWPSVHVAEDGTRGTRVETHLAHSDDGGVTWLADGPLWEATATDRGPQGESGSTDHEVPNLLPLERDGKVTWIGARLDLFVPAGGGLGQRPPSGFRIFVSAAPTVAGLASGPDVTLGSAVTARDSGVDTYLSDLDPDLGRCAVWNEPALHAEGDALFLALRCLALGADGQPDLARSSIELFATAPVGDPVSWSWRHVGTLAGAEDAASLGGEGLTQIDFARTRDGTVIAIVTPDRWSREHGEFIHDGIRVLEVESIEAASLARHANGELVVRAVVRSPDLEPLGPGAANYEPTSATGLVLMRRVIGPGSLVATIHATGIHP